MIHTLTDNARTTSDSDVGNILGPNITYARTSPLSDILAWLPALFILIGLPAVALVATKYVFLPSVKQAYAVAAASEGSGPMIMEKINLDTPATAATHTGFRSLALVGADGVFLDKVANNKDKIKALALADLKGIAMSDLYKPGVVENMRMKLEADFNRELGGAFVKDVYIAVWPTP